MMGCYDFCGHYDWTFAWLEKLGGRELLESYWREAISVDSQRHARALIQAGGFEGMSEYWGHTLNEESPSLGYAITRTADTFRIDIHDCPSKGFLTRNGLASCPDYCDHCMGWIGPMMRDAGFAIDHEHNHLGQCWWEMRPTQAPAAPSPVGAVADQKDVRLLPSWNAQAGKLDRFVHATDPNDKARSV